MIIKSSQIWISQNQALKFRAWMDGGSCQLIQPSERSADSRGIHHSLFSTEWSSVWCPLNFIPAMKSSVKPSIIPRPSLHEIKTCRVEDKFSFERQVFVRNSEKFRIVEWKSWDSSAPTSLFGGCLLLKPEMVRSLFSCCVKFFFQRKEGVSISFLSSVVTCWRLPRITENKIASLLKIKLQFSQIIVNKWVFFL